MIAPGDTPARRVLEGEPCDRRTALGLALRAGTATALAAGFPSVLAACSSGTVTRVAPRSDYTIFLFGTISGDPPGGQPLGDLVRLLRARAIERRVAPVLAARIDDDTMLGNLQAISTAQARVDPATGKQTLSTILAVVGGADPARVAPIAAAAMKIGVKVVSYLIAFEPRTAAITVDPAQLGTLLATHAAGWARTRLGGRGDVLLVGPAANAASITGFAVLAPASERALRATLARLAPRLRIAASVRPASAGDPAAPEIARALRAHPDVRMVLCNDDVSAVAAARALRTAHRGGLSTLYAGGLGGPSLTSRATIDALRGDEVLRAVVAARPHDLVEALVELPRALLRGEPARDVRIVPQVLTRGSAALKAYARDYHSDPQPDLDTLDAGGLTPLNPDLARAGAGG